jgi:hypothetical protein
VDAKGRIMDVGRVAKLAIGATVGIGGLALLAACGTEAHDEPTAPNTRHPLNPGGGDGPRNVAPAPHPHPLPPELSTASFVHRQFDPFDRNHKGGIGAKELTRTARGADIYGRDIYTGTDRNGGVHYKYQVGHNRLTESMRDAWNAAKGLGTKDTTASWGELAKLAARFDTDGRAGLSSTEQRAFTNRFAADVTKRERVWDGWDSWVKEPPRHHPAPDYPDTPSTGGTSHGDTNDYPTTPSTGGHTSTGDTGPYIPGGGTSTGDTGPSGGTSTGDTHSSGGTSSGDTHSSGGTSTGDSHPSTPAGGGNSTDNGNPGDGDF